MLDFVFDKTLKTILLIGTVFFLFRRQGMRQERRGGSRERVQGCTPSPPAEMTGRFSNTTGILPKILKSCVPASEEKSWMCPLLRKILDPPLERRGRDEGDTGNFGDTDDDL